MTSPFPVASTRLLFTVLVMIIISGCGIYSFSGASISPDVKTFSVDLFQNRATIVQPTLSQSFTESLRDKFLSQAGLSNISSGGDLIFEGYISDYSTQPVAITGSQTAALNRLTITVFVKFTNQKDPKNNFETSFSRYYDYDTKFTLTEVESDAIREISRQLVDDIFNKSVSNW